MTPAQQVIDSLIDRIDWSRAPVGDDDALRLWIMEQMGIQPATREDVRAWLAEPAMRAILTGLDPYT